MAEPKHIPRNAIVVDRYEELNNFTRAFATGHLSFLMVVGPAGTGKSHAMRAAMDGRAAWIDGNATAFGVYFAAFMHRDKPIVLDDVDALYRDASGVRLLKQLCQSEPSRMLGWYSDPRYLERRGVPTTFMTSSPVAIIAKPAVTSAISSSVPWPTIANRVRNTISRSESAARIPSQITLVFWYSKDWR